jgi:hypothetical protein
MAKTIALAEEISRLMRGQTVAHTPTIVVSAKRVC